MFEEYFFEKQRVINIFAQFHMRIEFSLKSIGYNNFNEQMMISDVQKNGPEARFVSAFPRHVFPYREELSLC